MREVTVTKSEFDEYLYPAFARNGVASEEEFEVALRVIRKLKEHATPEELSDEDIAEAEKTRGARAVAFLKLDSPEATFRLEEDEYKLVQKRLKAHLPNVALVFAEEFDALRQSVENAPQADEPAKKTAKAEA